MKHINKFKIIVPILLFILSSCVSQKKLIYLQNKDESTVKNEFVNERNEDYKVQVGDNLYIKINAIDDRTEMLFNSTENRYSQNQNDIGLYLNSYTVDKKGCIDFPLAGAVAVQNLSIEEIKAKIQEILNIYLKETLITVKLVNFNITMIGEISRPGQYKVYQDKINLFEALAMAGDLDVFANREQIKLIRQTKKGTQIHQLDLTDQNFLESDYYYLMPNDMIYVEPLKGKQFTFANFPYTVVFSGISTLILLISFIK